MTTVMDRSMSGQLEELTDEELRELPEAAKKLIVGLIEEQAEGCTVVRRAIEYADVRPDKDGDILVPVVRAVEYQFGQLHLRHRSDRRVLNLLTLHAQIVASVRTARAVSVGT